MEIEARRIGNYLRTISGRSVSSFLCSLKFELRFLRYFEMGFDLRILSCLIHFD